MTEKPFTTHRGETITFEDHNETWNWQDYSNTSIKKVKEYVDRAHKETLNGQTAITFPAWRERQFQKVTVTSCTDDSKDYWVKNAKGKREKVRAKALLADCPENDLKIAEVQALESQIEALNESRQRTEESFIRFGQRTNTPKAVQP